MSRRAAARSRSNRTPQFMINRRENIHLEVNDGKVVSTLYRTGHMIVQDEAEAARWLSIGVEVNVPNSKNFCTEVRRLYAEIVAAATPQSEASNGCATV